jgi:hypothetical protein
MAFREQTDREINLFIDWLTQCSAPSCLLVEEIMHDL